MSETVEGTENNPVPNKGFDFGDYDLGAHAERGAPLHLRHPITGNTVGIRFLTVGADSATYRRQLRQLQDLAAMYPEKEPTDSDTALLLGRARNAAAGLVGWESDAIQGQYVTVNDEAMEFSLDNAVQLLLKYFWAADQVLSFVNNRGNYSAA